MPQLGHAALQLVALAQQLLLLTHLDQKTNVFSSFVHPNSAPDMEMTK